MILYQEKSAVIHSMLMGNHSWPSILVNVFDDKGERRRITCHACEQCRHRELWPHLTQTQAHSKACFVFHKYKREYKYKHTIHTQKVYRQSPSWWSAVTQNETNKCKCIQQLKSVVRNSLLVKNKHLKSKDMNRKDTWHSFPLRWHFEF